MQPLARKVLPLIASSLLLFLGAGSAEAVSNQDAKILIHLQRPNETLPACSVRPTCSGIVTSGAASPQGENYYSYVLVTDGYVGFGVKSALFGIDYDGEYRRVGGERPLNVFSWTSCAPLSAASSQPAWPSPGSGLEVSWGSQCESIEPGFPGSGVVAPIGYFYMAAYGPARLAVTPHPRGIASVADCLVEDFIIWPLTPNHAPSPLGYAEFGGPGYNPCGLMAVDTTRCPPGVINLGEDQPFPFFSAASLDTSRVAGSRSAHITFDLRTGLNHARAVNSRAYISVYDHYTLRGVEPGKLFPITARLSFFGDYSAPAGGFSQVQAALHEGLANTRTFLRNTYGSAGIPFSSALHVGIKTRAGDPILLEHVLVAETVNNPGQGSISSKLEFLNLPPGGYITSCYGYSTNRPPDCTEAFAQLEQNGPPNHDFVAVRIGGVTDPDGDSLSIVATGVRQDEPVNDRGDGSTCPDARITSGVATVRNETSHAGRPDGRVYHIDFTATDPEGAACSGTVTVCVPPNRSSNAVCFDGGPRFNSLGECGAAERSELRVSTSRSTAVFRYRVRETGDASLTIFDVAGRRVASIPVPRRSEGWHELSWDASGKPPGLYFYRWSGPDGTATGRVLVRK